MEEFWDDRYSQDEFVYGAEPNAFVKEKLSQFSVGKILFPADGEGRNSVYAAELGWNVSAFDYSKKAKEKADKLASSKNVSIDFTVQRFLEEDYKKAAFDMICLTFVHFEPAIKTEMHKRLNRYLKIGGIIIFEAFSKEHRELNKLNPSVGGPPNEDMMYSIEEIKRDFKNYEVIELNKEFVSLNEGFGHVGESSVIRFIGRKVTES